MSVSVFFSLHFGKNWAIVSDRIIKMREPILKAVAMPMRIFWAPMYPAVINFVLQMTIWLMLSGVYGSVNALPFMFTIVFVHVLIIICGVREPHMSMILQSRGPFLMPSKNVYRSRGNKLAS